MPRARGAFSAATAGAAAVIRHEGLRHQPQRDGQELRPVTSSAVDRRLARHVTGPCFGFSSSNAAPAVRWLAAAHAVILMRNSHALATPPVMAAITAGITT
jgi:hypothetical protein